MWGDNIYGTDTTQAGGFEFGDPGSDTTGGFGFGDPGSINPNDQNIIKQWTDDSNFTGLGAALKSFGSFAKDLFGGNIGGQLGQMAAFGGLATLLNKLAGDQTQRPVGYQGGIPQLVATREQLPYVSGAENEARRLKQATLDALSTGANLDQVAQAAQRTYGISPGQIDAAMRTEGTYRRPGLGGITYFSPIQYSPAGTTPTGGTTGSTTEGVGGETGGVSTLPTDPTKRTAQQVGKTTPSFSNYQVAQGIYDVLNPAGGGLGTLAQARQGAANLGVTGAQFEASLLPRLSQAIREAQAQMPSATMDQIRAAAMRRYGIDADTFNKAAALNAPSDSQIKEMIRANIQKPQEVAWLANTYGLNTKRLAEITGFTEDQVKSYFADNKVGMPTTGATKPESSSGIASVTGRNNVTGAADPSYLALSNVLKNAQTTGLDQQRAQTIERIRQEMQQADKDTARFNQISPTDMQRLGAPEWANNYRPSYATAIEAALSNDPMAYWQNYARQQVAQSAQNKSRTIKPFDEVSGIPLHAVPAGKSGHSVTLGDKYISNINDVRQVEQEFGLTASDLNRLEVVLGQKGFENKANVVSSYLDNKISDAVKDSIKAGYTMDQVYQGAQNNFGISKDRVDEAIAATPDRIAPSEVPEKVRENVNAPAAKYTDEQVASAIRTSLQQGFGVEETLKRASELGALQDQIARARQALKEAGYASGGYMPSGIAMLAGGGNRFLRGPGDGVSDDIPAKFDRSGQPARLADGEFVIDARTVSEIGNGSSEAGARKLYAMMDRVHKARKRAKRGKPSGADRELNKLA